MLPGLAIAVTHRRLTTDPQPGHARGQPRHRLARRATPCRPWWPRAPPVELASSGGRALGAARGVLHRPEAQRPGPDELIRAIRVPAARGPQQFAKVGPRNAMVIAVCSFAVSLDSRGADGADRHRLGRPDRDPGDRGRGLPRGRPGRGRRLGAAHAAAGVRARPLRRAGGGRRPPDRRRARQRRLPAPRPRRARPADARLVLGGARGREALADRQRRAPARPRRSGRARA